MYGYPPSRGPSQPPFGVPGPHPYGVQPQQPPHPFGVPNPHVYRQPQQPSPMPSPQLYRQPQHPYGAGVPGPYPYGQPAQTVQAGQQPVPQQATHTSRPSTPNEQQEFITRLGQAVNAEYNAIRTYGLLADQAPDEEMKQIIRSIQSDESEHFRRFSELYGQLTGGQQAQVVSGAMPTSFAEGIEASIKDELKDSQFYQDTSLFTPNPEFQMGLMYASHDEARHATWFLYILSKINK